MHAKQLATEHLVVDIFLLFYLYLFNLVVLVLADKPEQL
jgi:hypothetical protein